MSWISKIKGTKPPERNDRLVSSHLKFNDIRSSFPKGRNVKESYKSVFSYNYLHIFRGLLKTSVTLNLYNNLTEFFILYSLCFYNPILSMSNQKIFIKTLFFFVSKVDGWYLEVLYVDSFLTVWVYMVEWLC